MRQMTQEQILRLHSGLLDEFGGLPGIRDEGLLESALYVPFQTFDGQDLYPTILEKAGRLGYGLIQNRPFRDGNKRIGIHALLVFLAVNGISLSYRDEDLIQAVLDAASGSLSFQDFCRWLAQRVSEGESSGG